MNVKLITAMIVFNLFCVVLCFAEPVKEKGSAKSNTTAAAHSIIEKKCMACHSKSQIDAALSAKKDMLKIQQEMEKKGAKLNANEREVLGIYWKEQNPLKKEK